MNDAHLHLLLTHLPIIFPIVGLLMMLGGIFFKSEILKRASYTIFVIGAFTALAAFLTGEGAEEVAEGIQGIEEQYIETHEETAEVFAILSYILGGLSLLGLWINWKKISFSNMFSYLTIIFTLLVVYYAKQTGTSGGEIRHTEIRTSASDNSNLLRQSNDHDD